MSIRFLFIVILFSLSGCVTKHTDMEVCFEHVQRRIKPDSILEKLMYSPIDSYDNFTHLLNRVFIEESKTDSICPKSIDKYISENRNNTITMDNLMLFQQFQAYLKHQKFDQVKARDSALYFVKKRKIGWIGK